MVQDGLGVPKITPQLNAQSNVASACFTLSLVVAALQASIKSFDVIARELKAPDMSAYNRDCGRKSADGHGFRTRKSSVAG